jgi:hypothetical protein
MANSQSQLVDQVGPFVAGSSSSELLGLAQQPTLALKLVDSDNQEQNQVRQRCDELKAAAKEFFCDCEAAAALVFQKTGDSEFLPEFIQYIYCWLLQDQLGGIIYSGLSSDAGSHEQIDQSENSFWDQGAEIAEALSNKYNQSPKSLLNYFNFVVYPAPPRVPDLDPKDVFSSFPRLVTSPETQETKTRIETHYWGPSVLLSADSQSGQEPAAGTAHTIAAVRKIFCNDRWLVVCNHKVERYVRTFESLHVFTKLVYLSRSVMDDLGRRNVAQRGAQIEAKARSEIECWEQSLNHARGAKQARISKLSQIL